MNHLALDLETLSLKENAHILSIGGVFFDPTKGEMGNTFYVELDLTLEQKGADISDSTLAWWESQPDGLLPDGNETLHSALTQLVEFINSADGDIRIYQQGDKDCLWLNDALTRNDIRVPWNYRNVFCARTLWSHVDSPENFVDYNGTVHNALDDAKFVAHRMMNILG